MVKEDAAPLIILVKKARETVMAPVMEDNMMDMLDVKEILSVAATTVRSLEPTIMERMIAVKNHHRLHQEILLN